MGNYHLPHWLQVAVAASGGSGVFLLAFLDATFMPFPSMNDLLLIDLSVASPARMPYYALMSTLGSVMGGVVLYLLAREGEEAAFHRRGGKHSSRIRVWVQRNGFVSLLIAGLLPPPTPFKVFVLAAGLLGMPLRSFVIALAITRSVRFYGEGYLAIRYGPQATAYLVAHKVGFGVGSLLSILVMWIFVRAIMRKSPQEQA
jgi:membrane protein YqaA with SNARE-associated domain